MCWLGGVHEGCESRRLVRLLAWVCCPYRTHPPASTTTPALTTHRPHAGVGRAAQRDRAGDLRSAAPAGAESAPGQERRGGGRGDQTHQPRACARECAQTGGGRSRGVAGAFFLCCSAQLRTAAAGLCTSHPGSLPRPTHRTHLTQPTLPNPTNPTHSTHLTQPTSTDQSKNPTHTQRLWTYSRAPRAAHTKPRWTKSIGRSAPQRPPTKTTKRRACCRPSRSPARSAGAATLSSFTCEWWGVAGVGGDAGVVWRGGREGVCCASALG